MICQIGSALKLAQNLILAVGYGLRPQMKTAMDGFA